jgi:hypothetical protein
VDIFTEKLTEDKDAMKALNLIASCTRVSGKGLAQLFTTGYSALAINIQPGIQEHPRKSGLFHIFRFHPSLEGFPAIKNLGSF